MEIFLALGNMPDNIMKFGLVNRDLQSHKFVHKFFDSRMGPDGLSFGHQK
ncbi:MAG: hypothetical protein CM15mL6_010 [uncultured marine virus]|nr:MAG: hypothetical protein CM15mL6_010 [uncultured marine virus]